MTIYVLCGLPASGKTTLSHKLAEEHNAELYCYDHIKPNRTKMFEQIKEALKTHDVVVDDLFLVKAWRKELLNYLRDVDCEKKLIVLETPIETCIERNKEREHRLGDEFIYHLQRRYQQPTLDEGWNDIQYIK